MTAEGLAAKLATPSTFTIGELAAIARIFDVEPSALFGHLNTGDAETPPQPRVDISFPLGVRPGIVGGWVTVTA